MIRSMPTQARRHDGRNTRGPRPAGISAAMSNGTDLMSGIMMMVPTNSTTKVSEKHRMVFSPM